jgi:hypothetical protein
VVHQSCGDGPRGHPKKDGRSTDLGRGVGSEAPRLEPGKRIPNRGIREGAGAMSFSRRMITLRRRLGLFVLVTAICCRTDRGRRHSV